MHGQRHNLQCCVIIAHSSTAFSDQFVWTETQLLNLATANALDAATWKSKFSLAAWQNTTLIMLPSVHWAHEPHAWLALPHKSGTQNQSINQTLCVRRRTKACSCVSRWHPLHATTRLCLPVWRGCAAESRVAPEAPSTHPPPRPVYAHTHTHTHTHNPHMHKQSTSPSLFKPTALLALMINPRTLPNHFARSQVFI
jgi:hypothetical protein